jgi:Secretion system C-terminal sorting domain
MLSVSSDITTAEAYRAVSSSFEGDIELLEVQLQIGSGGEGHAAAGFALYQNAPNPFSDQTTIGFHLPVTMDAIVTVYDIHGHVIRMTEGEFSQGYNEIELNGKELSVPGVYYYRLSAGDFTASRKFILDQE